MVRAVIMGGEIRPLEPLPVDWQDGQCLRIEKAEDPAMSIEQIDRDFAQLAKLCEDSDPAEEEVLDRAIQEARQLAKERCDAFVCSREGSHASHSHRP